MQPDAISLIYRIYIYNVWSFQLSNSSVPLARGIPWWPCRGVSKLTPRSHSLERHHRDPNPLAFCPWAWLHALDAGFWNTAWRCIYKLYHKSLRRGKILSSHHDFKNSKSFPLRLRTSTKLKPSMPGQYLKKNRGKFDLSRNCQSCQNMSKSCCQWVASPEQGPPPRCPCQLLSDSGVSLNGGTPKTPQNHHF